jgi:hypothetical protein
MRTLVPTILLSSFFPAIALAQSVVVPNANATTAGTSGLNTLIRNAANPRTYQYGVNASELAGIPIGSVLTGISLRLYPATAAMSWPAADITWANYDISVGPANPTATWGANPATNFSSPPQVVRTGPMTLDGGAFTATATPAVPNPWSEFYFDFKVPYTYTGGDLAMLFSHSGSSDAAAPPFPEVVVPSAATHGVSFSQSVYPVGTAMVSANFYVMRIHYGYGTGCGGATGTPVLVQNANTTNGAGGNIRLTIANAPPSSLCIYALGFTQLSAPLGGGCTLLTSPDVLLATLADTKGRAVQNIAVPPAVTGFFFAQGGVLDATAPNGISVTNGVSPVAQ